EADAAVADLDHWNSALASAARISDIANPSALACGTCRFQLVCPAFWNWLSQNSQNSAPQNTPAAVGGQLSSVQLGNDGDLQSITLVGVVATLPGMTTASLVTRRSIH